MYISELYPCNAIVFADHLNRTVFEKRRHVVVVLGEEELRLRDVLMRALSPIAPEKNTAAALAALTTSLRNPCEFFGVRVNARLTLVRATKSQDPDDTDSPLKSQLVYQRKAEQRVANQRRQLLLKPVKRLRQNIQRRRQRLSQKQRMKELTKMLEDPLFTDDKTVAEVPPSPAVDHPQLSQDINAELALMNNSPLLWIIDSTTEPIKLSDIFILVGDIPSSSPTKPMEKMKRWQHIHGWLTESGAFNLWRSLDIKFNHRQNRHSSFYTISGAHLTLSNRMFDPCVCYV